MACRGMRDEESVEENSLSACDWDLSMFVLQDYWNR